MVLSATKARHRPASEPPILESVVTAGIPRSFEGRFVRTRLLEERAERLCGLTMWGFRVISSVKADECDGMDRYRIVDVLKFDPEPVPAVVAIPER